MNTIATEIPTSKDFEQLKTEQDNTDDQSR